MNMVSSPFPLDGGRAGVGGARAGFAEVGAEGFNDASRASTADSSANTLTQPSPIEVDGGIHNLTGVARRDLERDAWFESQGYLTLRVSTGEIETDLDGVVARIRTLASNRLGKVI